MGDVIKSDNTMLNNKENQKGEICVSFVKSLRGNKFEDKMFKGTMSRLSSVFFKKKVKSWKFAVEELDAGDSFPNIFFCLTSLKQSGIAFVLNQLLTILSSSSSSLRY